MSSHMTWADAAEVAFGLSPELWHTAVQVFEIIKQNKIKEPSQARGRTIESIRNRLITHSRKSSGRFLWDQINHKFALKSKVEGERKTPKRRSSAVDPAPPPGSRARRPRGDQEQLLLDSPVDSSPPPVPPPARPPSLPKPSPNYQGVVRHRVFSCHDDMVCLEPIPVATVCEGSDLSGCTTVEVETDSAGGRGRHCVAPPPTKLLNSRKQHYVAREPGSRGGSDPSWPSIQFNPDFFPEMAFHYLSVASLSASNNMAVYNHIDADGPAGGGGPRGCTVELPPHPAPPRSGSAGSFRESSSRSSDSSDSGSDSGGSAQLWSPRAEQGRSLGNNRRLLSSRSGGRKRTASQSSSERQFGSEQLDRTHGQLSPLPANGSRMPSLSSLTSKGQPNLSSTSKGQPSLSSASKGQPSLSSTGKGQPSLSSISTGQPLTSKGQPSLSLTCKGQPSLSSTSKGQPSLSSISKGQPSLSLTSKGQPSLSSTGKGQPSLSSTSKAQPNLSSASKAQPNLSSAGKAFQRKVVGKKPPNNSLPAKGRRTAKPRKPLPHRRGSPFLSQKDLNHLLTTPDSALTRTSLRGLLTLEAYHQLTPEQKKNVTQFLPSKDQERDQGGGVTATSTAFCNVFFSASLREWQRSLTNSEFTIEYQTKVRAEERRRVIEAAAQPNPRTPRLIFPAASSHVPVPREATLAPAERQALDRLTSCLQRLQPAAPAAPPPTGETPSSAPPPPHESTGGGDAATTKVPSQAKRPSTTTTTGGGKKKGPPRTKPAGPRGGVRSAKEPAAAAVRRKVLSPPTPPPPPPPPVAAVPNEAQLPSRGRPKKQQTTPPPNGMVAKATVKRPPRAQPLAPAFPYHLQHQLYPQPAVPLPAHQLSFIPSQVRYRELLVGLERAHKDNMANHSGGDAEQQHRRRPSHEHPKRLVARHMKHRTVPVYHDHFSILSPSLQPDDFRCHGPTSSSVDPSPAAPLPPPLPPPPTPGPGPSSSCWCAGRTMQTCKECMYVYYSSCVQPCLLCGSKLCV